MKNYFLFIFLFIISTTLASAEVSNSLSNSETKAAFSGGTVSGQIKVMHVLSDKTNNFTPEEGSAYLGTLKYLTPEIYNHIKFGTAFYINGDTGLTDWDDTSTKKANGMFTAPRGDTRTLLGQAFLEYDTSTLFIKVGRQVVNSTLTKWSLMPNFYEAAIISYKPTKTLSLTLSHISKMAHGSRSTTDWGLIGEKTGTAGSSRKPQSVGGEFEQAKFHNLGTAAGVEKTDGMTVLGLSYNISRKLKISLWDYYAYDITNMFYANMDFNTQLTKGNNLFLNIQYLKQSNVGKDLIGKLDFTLYGAQVKIANKKYSAYLAYNSSKNSQNNNGFANSWGADPAYTSSLFSRNTYRNNVDAYKIGGHYTIQKGLKILASYANYGKSDTLFMNKYAAQRDATEIDIVLAYKPNKAWTLKLFNTKRTSEYDGIVITDKVQDRKMNHYRAIASYDF